VREIISIRLACAGAQEKKAVRKAGTKEGKKSQEVFILRKCVGTPSRRITTIRDTCVRLTDLSKRAKFHRYY